MTPRQPEPTRSVIIHMVSRGRKYVLRPSTSSRHGRPYLTRVGGHSVPGTMAMSWIRSPGDADGQTASPMGQQTRIHSCSCRLCCGPWQYLEVSLYHWPKRRRPVRDDLSWLHTVGGITHHDGRDHDRSIISKATSWCL